MKTFAWALAASVLSSPGHADEGFVEANLLGIFYHELGHALIDIENVPIFGQEEDAADVFSIFLIDALFDEEAAQAIAREAAYGFLGEAVLREEYGDEVAWWDVHGPDEQRFFNTVCLFYGADPDARQDIAEEFDLPDERADYCPDEYDQAADSWGDVLDEIWTDAPDETIVYLGDVGAGGSLTEQLIAAEVDELNAVFALSDRLTVSVEDCGEANAFYDPGERAIIMCSEFEDHLFDLVDAL